ncbi:hypothetical protein LXA43DRAFT_1057821 [Ganoderma leucocontextum]|nr:hypothetical protein LXA43DRAFT_1057821 [Ganoderma leucocontextum]
MANSLAPPTKGCRGNALAKVVVTPSRSLVVAENIQTDDLPRNWKSILTLIRKKAYHTCDSTDLTKCRLGCNQSSGCTWKCSHCYNNNLPCSWETASGKKGLGDKPVLTNKQTIEEISGDEQDDQSQPKKCKDASHGPAESVTASKETSDKINKMTTDTIFATLPCNYYFKIQDILRTMEKLSKCTSKIRGKVGCMDDMNADVEDMQDSVSQLHNKIENMGQKLEVVNNAVLRVSNELAKVREDVAEVKRAMDQLDAETEQERAYRQDNHQAQFFRFRIMADRLKAIMEHFGIPPTEEDLREWGDTPLPGEPWGEVE